MPWDLTTDVEAFASTAGDFLRTRPVQHTVLLTLIATLRRRGPHAYGPEDPVFGFWRAGGSVEAVLLQTPPHPMMFSSMPAAAVAEAAETLADRPLSGVNMTADVLDDFVERRGAPATVTMRTRLYLLDTLTPLPAPNGQARVATTQDRDLLMRWDDEFHAALGEQPSADRGAFVDERIGFDGFVLWEVDGVPVSMAARSRIEAGMSRVQSVYTPRELRGRGYAGAATAAVTQHALDQGAESVVLFTDLANPTSNGLYQRLGYRPVEDRVAVRFS
ncbi:GNAT family N-acetyltransferase [Paractinoplanes ferrugineus]|uniref:Acetyltransferase n=1 Tax=Paractinoplanes ferrugineus TaxID=113564 RepID=A0A919IXL6_9ACTN|nr:GNAT family N-acetyltransferase [Actinoplanes ferrugineus]GIE10073.1 acetyltransferase [Actinoplanes ferrugineus]